MRGHYSVILVSLVLCGSACGGSTPPPEEPSEPTGAALDSPDDIEQTGETADKSGDDGNPSEGSQAKSAAEPEFKEGMSVNDAINAVPPATDRENIEPEVLGKPLQEPKVYEPCKLGGARFKLKVAVWDGRAVGIDVSTTPNNPKLAECIKTEVAKVTWPDKVKSLNTVEYQF